MKRLVLIFIYGFILLTARSQNNGKDSLVRLITSAKEDTTKVNLLLELSENYKFSEPDTAALYARQALRLSRKLFFKKGEAMSLSSLALAYLYSNNRPKALETYFKALKIYEDLDDEAGIAFSRHNIGLCYVDQQEFSLALNYLHQSKIINERLHNQSQLLNNDLILGNCYEQMNRLDSARYFANQSYQLALQLHDMEKMGMTLRILGDIHYKMHQSDTAMSFYRRSLPLHLQINNQYGISNATIGIARLLKEAGQKDSVLYYAHWSLSAAREGGFPQLVLNVSSFLSDYFQSIHQVDSAFAYQQIEMDIKDTLFSQQKVKSLQQLTINEQERQQEIAAQKEQDAQERKENLQLLLIAIFVPVFFLLVVALSRSKAKLRTIEILGRLSLLLLFEFIALFIHPHIAKWTNHSPVLMLLILVGIGAILVPMHHRLEHWFESLVLKKQLPVLHVSKEDAVTVAEEKVKSEEK